MGTDAVLAALDRDGYAVVDGQLDPGEVRNLRGELGPLFAHTPNGRTRFEGPRSKHVYNLLAKTRATDLLVASPLVLALCDEILGHHQLSAAIAVEIGPGSWPQEIHADDAVYPLPRPHEEVVFTCLWALDDLEADAGATRVAPGSHRRTDLSPDPRTNTAPVPLRAGSVLLHRGSLWHGGGGNTTGEPRVVLNLEYVASWLRPMETQLLAVEPDVVRSLPRVLQELVGYNFRPPFLGFIDGRHPRRLLE